MRYELTKDMETGNAIIDGEHRELFDAVNRLMDACAQGKGRAAMEPTVEFLLDYVNKHFAHEEQLQIRSRYPGLEEHRNFHSEYRDKLRQIVASFPEGGPGVGDLSRLNGHIAILVSHIRTEDKRLGAFLANKR